MDPYRIPSLAVTAVTAVQKALSLIPSGTGAVRPTLENLGAAAGIRHERAGEPVVMDLTPDISRLLDISSIEPDRAAFAMEALRQAAALLHHHIGEVTRWLTDPVVQQSIVEAGIDLRIVWQELHRAVSSMLRPLVSVALEGHAVYTLLLPAADIYRNALSDAIAVQARLPTVAPTTTIATTTRTPPTTTQPARVYSDAEQRLRTFEDNFREKLPQWRGSRGDLRSLAAGFVRFSSVEDMVSTFPGVASLHWDVGLYFREMFPIGTETYTPWPTYPQCDRIGVHIYQATVADQIYIVSIEQPQGMLSYTRDGYQWTLTDIRTDDATEALKCAMWQRICAAARQRLQ